MKKQTIVCMVFLFCMTVFAPVFLEAAGSSPHSREEGRPVVFDVIDVNDPASITYYADRLMSVYYHVLGNDLNGEIVQAVYQTLDSAVAQAEIGTDFFTTRTFPGVRYEIFIETRHEAEELLQIGTMRFFSGDSSVEYNGISTAYFVVSFEKGMRYLLLPIQKYSHQSGSYHTSVTAVLEKSGGLSLIITRKNNDLSIIGHAKGADGNGSVDTATIIQEYTGTKDTMQLHRDVKTNEWIFEKIERCSNGTCTNIFFG